jgi:hypothetical protein
MITPGVQATNSEPSTSAAPATQTAATPAAPVHSFTFHDLLSDLNPLQYLPVVGTLYRAVTGDVIPEPVRDIGSLVVSGLMGGPIGIATFIATTLAEKATGIDPEKIVAAHLNGSTPPAAAPSTAPAAELASASAGSAPLAWTPEQLSASGVRADASGNLAQGDIEGADVLNNLELARLGQAAGAYAANQAASPPGATQGG